MAAVTTCKTKLMTRREYGPSASLAQILADIAADGHGGQLIVTFNDGGRLNAASFTRVWRGEGDEALDKRSQV
jgi:hypothetical protein